MGLQTRDHVVRFKEEKQRLLAQEHALHGEAMQAFVRPLKGDVGPIRICEVALKGERPTGVDDTDLGSRACRSGDIVPMHPRRDTAF